MLGVWWRAAESQIRVSEMRLAQAWYLRRQQWRLDMLFTDLRQACRLIVRDRALTIAAVLTLMLAIGANAAVFSVLEAVMLAPIPARDPDRLVVAWQTAFQGRRRSSPGAPRS